MKKLNIIVFSGSGNMRKRVLKPELIDTKTEFKEGFDGIADHNLRKVLVSLYIQQKKNDLKLEKIVHFCEYFRPSASKIRQLLFKKGKNKEVMEKIPITIEEQR